MNQPEPSPTLNDVRPLWLQVIEDMKERNLAGIAKYGAPLQAWNGRNAAIDAYQEAMDQAVYLRQIVEEYTQLREVYDAAKRFVDTGDATALRGLFGVPTSGQLTAFYTLDQLAERLYQGYCPSCNQRGAVVFKTGIFGDTRSFECDCGAKGSISLERLDFFVGDRRDLYRALIEDFRRELQKGLGHA